VTASPSSFNQNPVNLVGIGLASATTVEVKEPGVRVGELNPSSLRLSPIGYPRGVWMRVVTRKCAMSSAGPLIVRQSLRQSSYNKLGAIRPAGLAAVRPYGRRLRNGRQFEQFEWLELA